MSERDRKIEQSEYIKVPSREKLLRHVKRTLKESTYPTAIFLEGLSGTGKSSLAKQMENMTDVIIADGIESAESSWDSNLNMIVPLTPHELSILKEQSKSMTGRVTKEFVVKGLGSKESLLFLSKVPRLSSLSDDEILKYSSGLPELLNMFSTLKVNTENATAIVSRYLKTLVFAPGYFEDRKSIIEKYLEVPVVPEVLEAAEKLASNFGRENHIYNGLYLIRYRLDYHEIREKFDMNSVFFRAPESVEIYNSCLRAKKPKGDSFDIFVSDIPEDKRQIVLEALGFVQDGKYLSYKERQSIRMQAFGANDRKLYFKLRNETGNRSEEDLEDYLTGPFKTFAKFSKDGAFSLLLNKHEHEEQISDVMDVGWMLESLFQHLDIEYFVDNAVAGKKYKYDPNSRKIIFEKF